MNWNKHLSARGTLVAGYRGRAVWRGRSADTLSSPHGLADVHVEGFGTVALTKLAVSMTRPSAPPPGSEPIVTIRRARRPSG